MADMNEPYQILILYRPPHLLEESEFLSNQNSDPTVQIVDGALQKEGFDTQIILVGEDIEEVLRRYDTASTVIFNYCDGYHDGPKGYDPITGLYEALGFAYTGADDSALLQACQKSIAKAQMLRHGIPTPTYRVFDNSNVNDWNLFPAIVKPNGYHASYGITQKAVVHSHQELKDQVEYLLEEWQQEALVEDFIGGQEFRVSLWGNAELEVLPLMSVTYLQAPDPAEAFQDYDTKWDESRMHFEIPAQVKPSVKAHIEKVAKATYRATGMRDYGGIDLRLRGDVPYILDPNHNPDISEVSFIVRMAATIGYDYGEVLARIVRLAAMRRTRHFVQLPIPIMTDLALEETVAVRAIKRPRRRSMSSR
jgi:D-alanine-D-alanine ligase